MKRKKEKERERGTAKCKLIKKIDRVRASATEGVGAEPVLPAWLVS